MMVVVILLVLVALATILFFALRKTPQASKDVVKNYTVIEEVVENVIEVSGNIAAAQSQELQAAGSGTVIGVYASEGDKVKKGQTLVQLDMEDQEYELARLDYNIAQTKINGSPKELELMQLQRKALQKKLDNRKITASFSGVLADFDVAVGDYLEAQDSVGTLIERSYLKSYVEVVETDAPKLVAGQKVYCTFPAYTKSVLEGYVVSYPAVGTLTNRGASIVKVEIRIDNPPEEILPNYSFTGEIEISPPETLLLVEKEAVATEDGRMIVEKVLRDGNTQQIEVVAEPYGNSHMRITSGQIAAGDVLVGQMPPPVSGTGAGMMFNQNQDDRPGDMGGMGGMGGGMPPMR